MMRPSLLVAVALTGGSAWASPTAVLDENGDIRPLSPDCEGEDCVPSHAFSTLEEASKAALDGALENAQLEEERRHVEGLLQHALSLEDPRTPTAQRVQAAEQLGESGDPRVLGFLWGASIDRTLAVQVAAYEAAQSFPGDETIALAVQGLSRENEAPLTDAAAQLLVAQESEAAAAELYAIAGSARVSKAARKSAVNALTVGYPDYLAANGPPAAVSDPNARRLFSLANGVVGGFALSTVGAFGEAEEAAMTIGAIGGTGIGAGGSWLLTSQNPLTMDQSLAYSSSVGWGLGAGFALGDLLFPRTYQEGEEDRSRYRAVMRSTGALGGATLGWKLVERAPKVEDTLEVNLSTYLGSQVSIGLIDALDPAGANADEANDGLTNHTRLKRAAALVGGGLGAGVGYAIHDTWDLSAEDGLFSFTAAAEGAWLGYSVSNALFDEYRYGGLRLGAHLSGAAGLVYTHFRPVGVGQAQMAGWNALAANMMAGGIGLMADWDSQQIHQLVAPAGALGLVSGVWLGEGFAETRDDQFLVGIGTGLGAWNSFLLTGLLAEQNVFGTNGDQGFFMLTTGLSGLGAGLLSKQIDLDWRYTTFVGTSTAWGAFYALTGLAATDQFDVLDASGSIASVLVASNLGAGFAAWAGSESGFIDPANTGVANLGGLTGATLGTLAVLMASPDGQPTAQGALVGATLGIAGGALLTPRISSRKTARFRPSLPDLPGSWAVQFLPTVMENGELGAHVGLQGRGF